MRSGRFHASRTALGCAALIALCAPVAFASPPEETGEVVPVAAPPVAEPAPSVAELPAAEPPPAELPPAETPPADEVPPPAAPAEDGSRAAKPPVADDPARPDPAPADDPPRTDPAPAAAPAPVVAPPPPPATAARAWLRAAQDPPPEEEPVPTEPESALPPASDPGCVFPQPDPDLPDRECEVLASDCTVLGTEGPDILVGTAMKDLICGLGGDDEIDGGEGDDAILGGEGNDRLTGGAGADCMFGQEGEDELVDAAEEDVATIQDGEELPPPGPGYFEGRGVTREGECTAWIVASEGHEPAPPQQQGGTVSGSVEAAGIVYELSQLINEASGGEGGALPLDIRPTVTARDGIVPVLLECESTQLSGTLELLVRRGDRRVSVGDADFECTPPDEVVEVELETAAADRLEQRGRLVVTVRVDADGYARDQDFRLTIRGEQ